MKPHIIKTSTPRTELFDGIAQSVVTATWSDGTQTTERLTDIDYDTETQKLVYLPDQPQH